MDLYSEFLKSKSEDIVSLARVLAKSAFSAFNDGQKRQEVRERNTKKLKTIEFKRDTEETRSIDNHKNIENRVRKQKQKIRWKEVANKARTVFFDRQLFCCLLFLLSSFLALSPSDRERSFEQRRSSERDGARTRPRGLSRARL